MFPGHEMFLNGEGDHSGNAKDALWNCAILLPGNTTFNTDINQYTSAVYNFRVTYDNTNAGDPGSQQNPSRDSRPNGIAHDGISRDFNYGGTTYAGKNNNVTKMFYDQKGLNGFGGYYE